MAQPLFKPPASAVLTRKLWRARAHPIYQNIAVIAHASGEGGALVTAVEADRLRVVAQSGHEFSDCVLSDTFCAETLRRQSPVVVEDATLDSRFQENPFVVGPPHIRAYAGAPVVDCEGFPVGTVCVFGSVARRFSPVEITTLTALAELAACLLNFEGSVFALECIASRAGCSVGAVVDFYSQRQPEMNAASPRL